MTFFKIIVIKIVGRKGKRRRKKKKGLSFKKRNKLKKKKELYMYFLSTKKLEFFKKREKEFSKLLSSKYTYILKSNVDFDIVNFTKSVKSFTKWGYKPNSSMTNESWVFALPVFYFPFPALFLPFSCNGQKVQPKQLMCNKICYLQLCLHQST